jgi:HAD superfamily hydrolase (TIGR01549 family)
MDVWLIGRDTPQRVAEYLYQWCESFADEAIVCFDYFDTLVVRNVEPEHTKRLAAKLLSLLLHNHFSDTELYEFRRDLELQLCELNSAEFGNPEFNFLEFARYLYKILNQCAPDKMSFWTEKSFAETLLDIEVAVECAVQEMLDDTVLVLKRLKERNIKTVLVSDFYIPAKQYVKMLHSQGLADFFEHIYISTDFGEMKGTGKLYRRICKDLNCQPDQVCMIGDNEHADVVMAKQEGLKTLHVQNPKQRELYAVWKQQGKKMAADISCIYNRLSMPDVIFSEIGITFWFFVFRLFVRLRDAGVQNVFFFSKEGQMLKKIFDSFQQDVFGHVVIRSHYILVSRKATFLASLRSLEHEDFLRLFAHYRDIGLRDFLLSLNFSEKLAREICFEKELDYTARFSDLRNQPLFLSLLESNLFQQEYENQRTQQRRNILDYLESFGVDYKKEGLHIVDVGWKGSIQDNLYHVLGGEVDVNGYYVGSLIATELTENNKKCGVLFSDRPEPTPYFNVYNSNRSLFEMILGASHGSADGYYRPAECNQEETDKHRSIFKTVRSSSGEEINVMVLDLPEERRLFREVISPIQDTIFVLIRELNKLFITADCQIPDERWFAKHYARIVYRPKKNELTWFEDLYHLENFGVFEYTRFKSGQLPSWLERIKHLKNIITDPPLLETGIWPPVILRRLGIGFYQKIDGFLRYRREFK